MQTSSVGETERTSMQEFAAEDIDGVCIITYNYGISLLELEMIELAEKFICKALALLNHTSPSMLGSKSNMQNVYTHILRMKAEARKSSISRGIGFVTDSALSPDRLQSSSSSALKSAQPIVTNDIALSINMFIE